MEDDQFIFIIELLKKAKWNIGANRDSKIENALYVAQVLFQTDSHNYLILLEIRKEVIGLVYSSIDQNLDIDIHPDQKEFHLAIKKYESEVKFIYSISTKTIKKNKEDKEHIDIKFKDNRIESPHFRRIFSFHQPKTLDEWLEFDFILSKQMKNMPIHHPLDETGLRECQKVGIKNLEKSFQKNQPRALIQMATGAGKTFTAVSFIYRLIKFSKAKRILFLVDRNNLGRQAKREFMQYTPPDDQRKFTDLYNVQLLQSKQLGLVNKVCISTIQRIYSMLMNVELDDEVDEQSNFESDEDNSEEREKIVQYNPEIPIETFDYIIIDECHRSIYGTWKQVLEYFDAYLVGLSATPSKYTLGFFNGNLVMEYTHNDAVADGVNVNYEIFRIRTEITEHGGQIDSGEYVDVRDKKTREERLEALDEELIYDEKTLDRLVSTPDQIRLIMRTFMDKLPIIFPRRNHVPKTIIFAKDDNHAEEIVHIVRNVFGKGNEFCKKITYKVSGEKPEDIIAAFRNSYFPRIAVSVDMISTGTDIRAVECLFFMRSVKSQIYFEQMKGRGTRVINPTDLQSVTPDAAVKTHFVIVDAIGVCEQDKTNTKPLERKKTKSIEEILQDISVRNIDEDDMSSLAAKLGRLEPSMTDLDRDDFLLFGKKKPINEIISQILDSLNIDKQKEYAKTKFGTDSPSDKQIQQAADEMMENSCSLFDDPNLRDLIIRIRKNQELIIDKISQDQLIDANFDRSSAAKTVDSFKDFLRNNKSEIDALKIFFNLPYEQRSTFYEKLESIARKLKSPPYSITPEKLWMSYDILEKTKVKKVAPLTLLTNLVSIFKFEFGEWNAIEPFTNVVEEKFESWLKKQTEAGIIYNAEQLKWLKDIKEHISKSLSIQEDHFQLTPFVEHGGLVKFYNLFGNNYSKLLKELNEMLVY